MTSARDIAAGLAQRSASWISNLWAMRSQKRKGDVTRSISYALLLVVAAYTTWHGMNAIVSESLPQGDVGVWLVTVLVSATLFVIMNWAVSMWVSFRSFGQRFVALLLYAFVAAASVSFAFTFWWSVLFSRDRTVNAARDQTSEVLRVADAAEGQLRSMQVSISQLATLSRDRAAREETEGGTCGDGSDKRKGPRYHLRVEDAENFSAAALYIATLADPTTQAVGQLRQQIAQVSSPAFEAAETEARQAIVQQLNSNIDRVGRQVQSVRNDAQLLQFQTQFRARIEADRTGFNRDGEQFQCPDETLRTRLEGAYQAIQGLRNSADLTGMRVEVMERGKANLLGFGLLLNTFVGTDLQSGVSGEQDARRAVAQASERIGQPIPKVSNKIEGREWFAFFLALAIDLGIAAIGFSKRRDPVSHLADALLPPDGGEFVAIGDILDELRSSPDTLRSMVGPYGVNLYGEDYLIVPLRPATESVPRAFRRAPFEVQNLATVLQATNFAEEVAPRGFVRHQLMLRLEANSAQPPPRSSEQPTQGSPHSEPPTQSGPWYKTVAQLLVDRVRWMMSTGLLDRKNSERSHLYRYFRIKGRVLGLFYLQDVARRWSNKDGNQPPR